MSAVGRQPPLVHIKDPSHNGQLTPSSAAFIEGSFLNSGPTIAKPHVCVTLIVT